MKATVQYNDLVGTAAADISDFYNNSLQAYLQKRFPKYDSGRFSCVGCDVFLGGQGTNHGTISFICLDKVENKYVRMRSQNGWTVEEVISIFKRLSIVIGKGIHEIETDGSIVLDQDE